MLNLHQATEKRHSSLLKSIDQPLSNQHQTISIFCAIIAIVGVTLYWLLQLGFAGNDISSSLRLLGLSFFLLFIPATVYQVGGRLRKPIRESWLFNEASLSLYALLLIYLSGTVAPLFPGAFCYVFVVPGYAGFILHGVSFIKKHCRWYILAGIPVTLLFSLWAMCRTILPGMLETVIAGDPVINIDFWFNVAYTNMIKTYNIPSTGLDGLPWMYYHYGCHFLFAQISKLLQVSMKEMFAAGYAIIFVPFFFKTYLSFAITVRSFVFGKPKEYKPLNLIFWIMVLSIFIQILRNLYSGGLLGYIFLDSVSYTVAMGVMFAFFSACLYFWNSQTSLSKVQEFFFCCVFLPVTIACLGFLKVSIMYNVLAVGGYLFLRLQLYKKWYYWVSSFILLLVFWGVYTQVVETLTFGDRKVGYEGRIEYFYFFRNTHEFRPFLFIFFFHQWLYLLIFLTLYQHKAFRLPQIVQIIRQKKTLAVECGVVLVVTGLLPSFFLHLSGGNAMYFMGTQLFFCSALVLSYLHGVSITSLPSFKMTAVWKNMVYSLLLTAAFVVLFARTQFIINDLLRANTGVRKKLLQTPAEQLFNFTEVVQLAISSVTGNYSEEQRRALTWYSPAVQEVLNRDSTYIFLTKVSALDGLPMVQKRNSAIYTNFTSYILPFKVPCGVVPFFIPGLSGIAMIVGQPYDCPMGGWGFEYYNTRYKHYPGWDKIFTQAELCRDAQGKSFSELILFNEQKEKFQFVKCTK